MTRDEPAECSFHRPEPGDHPSDPPQPGGGRSFPGNASLQLPRQLRYSCTKDERNDLEELAFYESHGGGSKWKAIGCGGICVAIGLAALLLQVAPPHRPWIVVGVFVAGFLTMLIRKILARGSDSQATEVEIRDDGLQFVAGPSSFTISASSVEKLIESDRLFALKSKTMLICLPKRVFENDEERDGFRALATDWTERARWAAALQQDAVGRSNDLSVEFGLRFRDYIDRTLTSWRPRVLCAAFLSFFVGVFVYASFRPAPPGAVFSTAEVLVYFMVPALLLQAFVFLGVDCIHAWFSEAPHRCDARLVFNDRGVERVTATDRTKLAWSEGTRFKESRRAFYIWWPGTQGWLIVPKRAFDFEADIGRCRALLAQSAENSTWFWR